MRLPVREHAGPAHALQNSGGNSGPDDCSGAFAFDLNARIQSGLESALAPGAIVYAQFGSRDPNAVSGANRSDALRVGIAP